MIPSLDEITRGVVGAGLLLKNDARGMAAFDTSLQGFIKSFFAALLVLPAYAFVHWVQSRGLAASGTPMATAVLAYGLQWLAFPVTAAVLAKLMSRTALFVPYVVAANWASVVQIAIVAVVVVVSTILPASLAGLALLALTIGLVFYDYLVAKFAFGAPGLDGVGVVVVQLLVSMLVQRWVAGG